MYVNEDLDERTQRDKEGKIRNTQEKKKKSAAMRGKRGRIYTYRPRK